MVSLVGRRRGRAVGADPAAGGAAGAVAPDPAGALLDDRRDAWDDPVDVPDAVRAHDGLVQAAPQLYTGQVAPGAVHRVVVPGWQQQRSRVVVSVTATCRKENIVILLKTRAYKSPSGSGDSVLDFFGTKVFFWSSNPALLRSR